MKYLFALVLGLLGATPALFAESDGMKACRAAYDSLDPWKVFDDCGQLIADGDLPEDPIVWDWLMLAERHVNREEPNRKYITAYRERSEQSGARTGSVVWNEFDKPGDEGTRKKLFNEALSFGPWFSSYVHSRRANSLASSNWTKEAVAEYDKAIKLKPHYDDLFARGKIHNDQRREKKALEDFRRSAEISASLGLTNTWSYTWLGYQDKKTADALREQAEKNRTHDPSVLRQNVLTLAEGGKLDEALRACAGLVAYQPTVENWELRGDLQALAGDDLKAAQNYLIAMQMDDAAFRRLHPKWSAAMETFAQKRKGKAPANLLELVASLSTFAHEKGNLAPKYASNGLRTQWQADGSLRFWTQDDAGFYLLPDGVKFQKARDGGARGPVESPQETAAGKRIYPVGEFRVAYFPDGSFFFGLLKPLAKSENGRHVTSGGKGLAGPFLAGQSVHAIREVSRRTDGAKTIITFTDGLVETTEAGRQSVLDIPGFGTFRGDLTASHLPYTGVLTSADDKSWSVVYQGRVWKTGPKGTELYVDPSRDGWLTLAANGDLTDNNHDAWNRSTTTYPASGEAPTNRTEANRPVDWREYERAQAEQASQAELDEALRRARTYVPETTRRACYRCNGSGQMWQGGGASQSRISAPSGSTASQREDFYNSAGSIRTTYSSGGMVPCSTCGGTGSY